MKEKIHQIKDNEEVIITGKQLKEFRDINRMEAKESIFDDLDCYIDEKQNIYEGFDYEAIKSKHLNKVKS